MRENRKIYADINHWNRHTKNIYMCINGINRESAIDIQSKINVSYSTKTLYDSTNNTHLYSKRVFELWNQ